MFLRGRAPSLKFVHSTDANYKPPVCRLELTEGYCINKQKASVATVPNDNNPLPKATETGQYAH